MSKVTDQNSSSGSLPRDELSGPVLGIGDKSAFELFFGLPRGLGEIGLGLEVALAVLGGGLLTAADDGESPPEENDEEPSEEGEDAGEEEAPPLAFLEAFQLLGRVGETVVVVRHLVGLSRIADVVVVFQLRRLLLVGVKAAEEIHFDGSSVPIIKGKKKEGKLSSSNCAPSA